MRTIKRHLLCGGALALMLSVCWDAFHNQAVSGALGKSAMAHYLIYYVRRKDLEEEGEK